MTIRFSSESPRITIIGGGSIGLCLAWELAQRDCHVTLVERDSVGRSTSWAAAGILPPAKFATATDPIDQLRGYSHELFPDWVQRLTAITGIDTGFRQCGGWYLANTPGERAAMIGMTDYWQDLQIRCESISLGEVSQREPQLRDWLNVSLEATSAWWAPDECQIRSPDYLKALVAACEKFNVDVQPQTEVTNIESNSNSVIVSTASSHSDIETDVVIVCSGTWTGMVAPMLQLESSIVPVRGQMLLLKTESPYFQSVVNVGHRYLVAREDGHTLIGSCEEEVGLNIATTEAAIESLREFAIELCPNLHGAKEIKTWAGLRPMTFDGFPIIGRVPHTRNVYVASGHFRSGLHLSPATARVLADEIMGIQPAVDLHPFRVGKQQGPNLVTKTSNQTLPT